MLQTSIKASVPVRSDRPGTVRGPAFAEQPEQHKSRVDAQIND